MEVNVPLSVILPEVFFAGKELFSRDLILIFSHQKERRKRETVRKKNLGYRKESEGDFLCFQKLSKGMGELLKTEEIEKGYNGKKLRERERGLGACRRQQGRKRGMAAVLFRSRKGGHSPRMSSVHFLSQVKPFPFVESPSWMLFAPLPLSPERRKGEFASSSSSHDKGPLSLSVPAWLARLGTPSSLLF